MKDFILTIISKFQAIDKKPLMIGLLCSVIMLALNGIWDTNTVSATTKKPNIIVILADDLGWNDVGFHGSEIKTPNLDKLANSSVRLERFYVKAMCTPTRAALMTGRHPFRYGMSDNVIWAWEKAGLPLDEKTIAQTLKDAGYYTAIVGKWHLGHYKQAYLPTQRGFDYHYGHYCGGVDYFTHEHRPGALDWHRNENVVEEEGYTTDLIGQEAVKLINNHDYDKSPLFLYVSFNAPHSPLQAKQEDIDGYRKIQDEGRRVFAAQVQSMDEAIGNIVKVLKEKGIQKDTLLFFTSDNGGGTYQPWHRGDNRPLRGYKGSLYEGGVRVPTFISYPAKIKGGEVSDQIFSIVDLYPTFANLAGIDSDHKLDGIDLIKSLATGTTTRDELLIQYKNNSTAAIIKGDYKLVKNGMTPFAVSYHGMVELFDLNKDPLETHNLAYSQPEKTQELQQILANYEQYAAPSILKSTRKQPQEFVMPKIMSPQHLQINNTNQKQEKSFFKRLKTLSKGFIVIGSFFVGVFVSYLTIVFLGFTSKKQRKKTL